MRLIDAEVFEELFNKQIEYGATDIFDAVEDALQDTPAVDAAPVVHAKWIYGITLGHEWRKCSKCLVSQEIFGCFTYCPNCGARMDEKEND